MYCVSGWPKISVQVQPGRSVRGGRLFPGTYLVYMPKVRKLILIKTYPDILLAPKETYSNFFIYSTGDLSWLFCLPCRRRIQSFFSMKETYPESRLPRGSSRIIIQWWVWNTCTYICTLSQKSWNIIIYYSILSKCT